MEVNCDTLAECARLCNQSSSHKKPQMLSLSVFTKNILDEPFASEFFLFQPL